MEKLSKKKLIKIFNNNFIKMSNFIKNKTDKADVIYIIDSIDDALYIDCSIIINEFYNKVYKKHKQKIIDRDEDFLEYNKIKNFINRKSDSVYVKPLIQIYKLLKKEEKDVLYNYFLKLIKICDYYC
jgi:CHAT domain-containing protein